MEVDTSQNYVLCIRICIWGCNQEGECAKEKGPRRKEEKQVSQSVAELLYGWEANRTAPEERAFKKCLVFKWKEFIVELEVFISHLSPQIFTKF